MASIPINNLTNKTDINGAELLPFVRDGKTFRCSVSGLFYNDVITTLKIANSAVTTDKINNDAITTIKLANSAITTEKINNSAITTIKLANSAVTTDKINNDAITTIKLANSAITTDKINNSAITTDKINNSAITTIKLANSAITTDKIASSTSASDGVTYAKLQRVANMKVIGNVSGSLGVASEVSILDEDNMISDSATAIPTQQSVKAYVNSSGVIAAASLNGGQTGSAPIYGVRAWVSFDASTNVSLSGSYSRSGTVATITSTNHNLIAGNLIFIDFTIGAGTAPFDGLYEVASVTNANTFTVVTAASVTSIGTVYLRMKTIRGSGNISCVSSALDNPGLPPASNETAGVGRHIVNFSIGMPDTNYAISGGCIDGSAALDFDSGSNFCNGIPYNEKSAFVITGTIGGGSVNGKQCSVSIIR